MGKQITDYLLYRWRYILGYGLIGLTVIGMLIVAAFYIPGGITKAEMDSVVASNALNLSFTSFDPSSIINLPYHFLQHFSIELLGVSLLSIKLPSLLLGIFSFFGMLLLLRIWFRQNVAVLTSILVITAGQFVFMAQNGTSDIIYVFWSVWLLVAALKISRRSRFSGVWKILLFGIAALSLYTPLSLYILLALGSAILLHPHLRYLVRQLSKVKVAGAALCALILVLPLVYVCIRHPSLTLMLLGIPHQLPSIQANLLQLLNQYLDFVSSASTLPMTPIYGLGPTILIGLGVIRMITTKYTARSYIIVAWIILLLPVLIINPNFISVTFVPVILLMAMGISMLISNWYRLFPRNPYARLAGLIPLTILIAGMVFSGINRYMYGYLYDPNIVKNFSTDLQLVNQQFSVADRGQTQLIVGSDEVPFYTVVAHYNQNVAVASQLITTQQVDTIIISRELHPETASAVPYRIITNGMTENADRFYVYKTSSK